VFVCVVYLAYFVIYFTLSDWSFSAASFSHYAYMWYKISGAENKRGWAWKWVAYTMNSPRQPLLL